MVVTIFADIIEIVVFPSGTYAFLGVDYSFPLAFFARGVDCAKEDGLELVHARICEEEGRI